MFYPKAYQSHLVNTIEDRNQRNQSFERFNKALYLCPLGYEYSQMAMIIAVKVGFVYW